MIYNYNGTKVEPLGQSRGLEQVLENSTRDLNTHALRVNKEIWNQNLLQMAAATELAVKRCQDLVGSEDFRPNSPADCAYALFKARGKEPKTFSKKTMAPTVDADVLEQMKNEGDELAGEILVARSLISKLGQLKKWEPFAQAGKVWAIWNSMGQPHGRYTSEDPCLSNRIDEIRETIEAEPGFTLLSLDLGQAEYVTWASLSGDPVLSAAFEAGLDFHMEMARSVKELVPEWEPEDLRAAGKTINFAILYQMTPFALARKLGCSGEIAQKIINAYYDRVKVAKAYIRKVLDGAKAEGHVDTKYGRRRYCPNFKYLTDRSAVHEAEKSIWHHHNAGTAAEYLKMKQVAVVEAVQIRYDKSMVWLALNMYDEIVLQVRDDVLDEVRALVEPIFAAQEPGFLKFPVTVKVGKTWGETSK